MALKTAEVRALADRVAASHGLEIVDIELSGSGPQRTLRVFIEKDEGGRRRLREALAQLQEREDDDAPGQTEWDREWLEALPSVPNLEFLSGITHEDCEVFSRDFGTVLDVEDLVPGSEYLLEVSSPGLDRRLATERDFERFTGSLVKLETHGTVPGAKEGQRKWRGRLRGVEEGKVLIQPEEAKASGNGAKGRKRKMEPLTSDGGEGASIAVPLGAIDRAHLVPEF